VRREETSDQREYLRNLETLTAMSEAEFDRLVRGYIVNERATGPRS
jgi:hypothetical protein